MPELNDEQLFEVEQLNLQVETAQKHFLEVAKTEGLSSEIAKEAIGTYHDLLQILAAQQDNRDLWFCTEVYKTYVEAAKINPEYQDMVGSAQEDLDMLQ